jgi:hypothetical protein
VDAAASWTGRFAAHLYCSSLTTGGELHSWLAKLHAAAKNAAKGQGLGMLAGISGLQDLPPATLAACSQALVDLCRQMQRGRSKSTAAATGSCSADIHVAVMVEVPACDSCTGAGDPPGMTPAGRSSRRPEVLGALQLCGRTMTLQPPSLVVLLESQLRQLGYVDCRAAGHLLAELLQQVVDCRHASAIDNSTLQELHSPRAFVSLNDVRKVLSWLNGMQKQQDSRQQTGPQPGSSAMGVLGGVAADCLLPELGLQHHDSVLGKLQEGLQHASQAGKITGRMPAEPFNGLSSTPGSHLLLSEVQQAAGGAKESSCSTTSGHEEAGRAWWQQTEADVRAAVLDMCQQREHRQRQLQQHQPQDMACTDNLPLLWAEPAAAAAGSIHVALQQHGCCLLVGPAGVGKTLSCQLLDRTYRQVLGPAVAPCWVRGYATVLESACLSFDNQCPGSTQPQEEDILRTMMAVLQSWHSAAVQLSLRQQQGQQCEDSSVRRPPPEGWHNVVVLDVADLHQGPLLQVLLRHMHMHMQQAATSSSCSRLSCQSLQPQSDGAGWLLPGGCGLVIECCSTAAVSPELVQLMPVVAVRPPGILDTQGQLLEQMRACFPPLAVLPQSPHCTGWQAAAAAAAAAGIAPANIINSSSNSRSDGSKENMQDSNVGGVSPTSVHLLNQCGGPDVTTVAVSQQELKSLASLLGSMVSAGLSLQSCPAVTMGKWQSGREGAEDVPASVGKSSCSHGGSAAWEASMEIHACCSDIIAVAGAMWRSSHPCQSTQTCSFIRQGDNSAISAAWSSMHKQWPHLQQQPQTTAEQFAARLLVFCSAWVLAGRCGTPLGGAMDLQQAFKAVLTGAGYSWALPDGGATATGQLFSARPSLATGQWVPWAADAAASCDSSCFSQTAGTASAAEQGVAAESLSPCGPSGGCDGCMASSRTRVLQYLTWWMTKAGRNVLLLGPPDCGIAEAVNRLISCLVPAAALQPAELAETDVDACKDGQGTPSTNDLSIAGGIRSSSNTRGLKERFCWLRHTPGSAPEQLGHVLLEHVQLQQAGTPVTTPHAAGGYSCWFTGHAVPFSPQLWLYDEDFVVPSSGVDQSGTASGASEWLRQLLETKQACSFARALHSRTAHDDQPSVQEPRCTVIPTNGVQLLAAHTRPSSRPFLFSGTSNKNNSQSCTRSDRSRWRLGRHLVTFHVCCLSAIPLSADEDRGQGSSAAVSAAVLKGAVGVKPSCLFSLVDRKQMLTAVLAEYQELFPRVHNVAKPKLLEGVIATFDGLTAALQQLHHGGGLPACCSIQCFGMQGCRQVLQDALRLCAADRSELDLAASEEQAADPDGIATLLQAAPVPLAGTAAATGASLWSRRVALKSFTFALLEGLCRWGQ